MKSTFLVLVTAALCSTAYSTVVKPADCKDMKLHEVRIEGCSADPCQIVKGKNLSVEFDIEFQKPDEAYDFFVSALARELIVKGEKRGEGYRVLTPRDGCEAFKVKCPAKAGVKHTLKMSMYVAPNSVDFRTLIPTAETKVPVTIEANGAGNCYLELNLKFVEK